MSLLSPGKLINVEQNTDQWLEWRQKGIGGSDAAVIKLGEVYGETIEILWAQKTGYVEKSFNEKQQVHIDRGHDLEPAARERFAELTGFRVKPVCMQSSTYPFMLASLDGMTEDLRVGVEIKAHSDDVFKRLIASDSIQPHYYAQIQHQLAVTGAREFYFWATNENIPPYYFLRSIRPDYPYIEDLIRREQQFQHMVEARIKPTGSIDSDITLASHANIGLIMLSGAATAGKDEMALIYSDIFGCERFSPSDPLRETYCNMVGITAEQLNKAKEKHRPALVALGHGMRSYVPNVWIDAVFNEHSGIFEAMLDKGALFTSTRYLNEWSHGRLHAERLNVPCRLIYIERPKVKFANETEAATLPLVKQMSDTIFVNDCDVHTPIGRVATELALVDVIARQNALSTWSTKHQIIVKASNHREYAKAAIKERKSGEQSRAKRSARPR